MWLKEPESGFADEYQVSSVDLQIEEEERKEVEQAAARQAREAEVALLCRRLESGLQESRCARTDRARPAPDRGLRDGFGGDS